MLFCSLIFLIFLPLIFLAVVPTLVEWQVFRAVLRHPQATIGIIGDSHAACGVNPEFFPELVNFAQRASQPMVWRAKLGVILFIKGVLCPFFKRCVTGSRDGALQDNYYRLDRQLAESSWYKKGAKLDPDSWGHVPAHSDTPVRAEIEDILAELNRRHVKPILLTMPFWAPARNQLYTPADQAWFAQEMQDLSRKYGCPWINMVDELPEPENWSDDSHLNTTGAERCTKMLEKRLMEFMVP